MSGATHAADAAALQAQTDLTTAYNAAAGSGPTIPVAADLGGQTLTPGVYNSASSLALTGTLTLSGTSSDVWIFQAGSTLTTASGSSVVFTGGASACNVFWQVGSSATMGTGSAFKGTIMALTAITVTTGVTIDGRVLARDAAVTLDADTIDASTCAAAIRTPTPAPTPTPTPIANTDTPTTDTNPDTPTPAPTGLANPDANTDPDADTNPDANPNPDGYANPVPTPTPVRPIRQPRPDRHANPGTDRSPTPIPTDTPTPVPTASPTPVPTDADPDGPTDPEAVGPAVASPLSATASAAPTATPSSVPNTAQPAASTAVLWPLFLLSSQFRSCLRSWSSRCRAPLRRGNGELAVRSPAPDYFVKGLGTGCARGEAANRPQVLMTDRHDRTLRANHARGAKVDRQRYVLIGDAAHPSAHGRPRWWPP